MATNDVTEVPADAPGSARDRLAIARKKAAKREEVLAAEADSAELERLELVEKFEQELGRDGRDFAVVDVSDLGEGHVVVKLGEPVLYKAFTNSKMTEMDIDAFVFPCVVHPTKDVYRKLAVRRPGAVQRCLLALSKLYGLKVGDDQKK